MDCLKDMGNIAGMMDPYLREILSRVLEMGMVSGKEVKMENKYIKGII